MKKPLLSFVLTIAGVITQAQEVYHTYEAGQFWDFRDILKFAIRAQIGPNRSKSVQKGIIRG